MLTIVYYYFRIDYLRDIKHNHELKTLLHSLNLMMEKDESISNIDIDETNKQIIIEASEEGYKYLKRKKYDSFEISLIKVVYYLSSAYKYKRQ